MTDHRSLYMSVSESQTDKGSKRALVEPLTRFNLLTPHTFLSSEKRKSSDSSVVLLSSPFLCFLFFFLLGQFQQLHVFPPQAGKKTQYKENRANEPMRSAYHRDPSSHNRTSFTDGSGNNHNTSLTRDISRIRRSNV